MKQTIKIPTAKVRNPVAVAMRKLSKTTVRHQKEKRVQTKLARELENRMREFLV